SAQENALAYPSLMGKHDGIRDGHGAAFGLGKSEAREGLDDTRDDLAVAQIGACIRRRRDVAVEGNQEARGDTALDRRILQEAWVVAAAEAAEVGADDPVHDLGGEAARHGTTVAPADPRRPRAVVPAHGSPAPAEALADQHGALASRPVARGAVRVPERADA